MKKLFIIFLIFFNTVFIYGEIENGECDGRGNCKPQDPVKPEAGLGDVASMIMQQAVDPNELEGPVGVDSVRWVSKNDMLSYTVFFENDQDFATAHAQIVDISIDMPDARLLNDFKLGTYTFANRSYEMPNEPNFYSMRLDCRDSLNIYVDVLAGMDAEKKQAFWRLSSIDPESGHAPWEVDRGLLPVNDSTHVGEGFVTFRIKPYDELVTGDTISFFANIVFDSNDTIPTNRWCNRIDAGAPTSRVKATVDNEDYSHYRLTFDAEDDRNGSGVDRVLLYLADNLGNYEEYATCAVDSVLDFYVEKGRQYNFMTVAVDRVGNHENIKLKPDLTLNFNEPPTDLLLSNTVFQDDIELDGFIGELSTVDTEGETGFTYALSEGEGAIHNDMFSVVGNRLQANDCFKCSDLDRYSIRLSTTDVGGLSFSKAFSLDLRRVLEQPEPQTLDIEICEGETYSFHGETYRRTGTYSARVPNEFMCDSIYTLNLRVNPVPEPPVITVKGRATLVSSAEQGNQWYKDGEPVEGAREMEYTATESGLYSVTASNGRCESEFSDEVFVNLSEGEAILIPLKPGWNWISSNLEPLDPNTFFGSATDNVVSVRGHDGQLENNSGTLTGDISDIVPATYKVQASRYGQIELQGTPVDPESFGITLNPGWTWIPYLPTVSLAPGEAFSDFTPRENDVIKGHTEFAVYANGKWNGPLKSMKPNSGYMYFTSSPSEFHYSSSKVTRAGEYEVLAEIQSDFTYQPSAYPDNMTVVAELFNNDVKVMDGMYSIGAFCGNECRGTGIYEDGKIYMTIHGVEGNDIKFIAIENATGKERNINETLSFSETPAGTFKEPFILTLDKNNRVDDVASDFELNIYPNPVRDRLFIAGDTSGITNIKIISPKGTVMISTADYENGIDVTSLDDGVYIAAVAISDQIEYRKFVKKK